MILKYILYGSIWSKFGAKNSKSRTNQNVPQISNVLISSQPQPNINATRFVIYHNKNALKSPGKIYRGLLLIFLCKLNDFTEFLSNFCGNEDRTNTVKIRSFNNEARYFTM
jgi:hypothetical protein